MTGRRDRLQANHMNAEFACIFFGILQVYLIFLNLTLAIVLKNIYLQAYWRYSSLCRASKTILYYIYSHSKYLQTS